MIDREGHRTQGPNRSFRHSFSWAFRVYSRIFVWMFVGLFIPLQFARTDHQRDSIAYYGATQRARDGESLYTPYPLNRAHDPNDGYPFYLYPPPFAATLAYLPRMEYRWFARVMLLASVGGFWLFAAGIAFLARGSLTWDATRVAAAALFFWPGMNAGIQNGNVDLLLLPAVAWAVASPRLRGGLLVVVAAVKTFGVWALVAWVIRRPKKALASAGLASAITAGLTLGTLGAHGTRQSSLEWAENVAPTLGQGEFNGSDVSIATPWGSTHRPWSLLPSDVSISFAPVLLAAREGLIDPSKTLPGPVRLYLLVLGVLAPIAAMILTMRQDTALQCAAVLATSVLFAPLTRPVYLAYVLPLGVLVWRLRHAGLSREVR